MIRRYSKARGPDRDPGRAMFRSSMAPDAPFDQGTTRRRSTPVGLTKASCWCEKHFVYVDIGDIARGLTASCGSSKCDAIAATQREKDQ